MCSLSYSCEFSWTLQVSFLWMATPQTSMASIWKLHQSGIGCTLYWRHWVASKLDHVFCSLQTSNRTLTVSGCRDMHTSVTRRYVPKLHYRQSHSATILSYSYINWLTKDASRWHLVISCFLQPKCLFCLYGYAWANSCYPTSPVAYFETVFHSQPMKVTHLCVAKWYCMYAISQ